jgi:DNA-binding beta-propeller fold protein YncE
MGQRNWVAGLLKSRFIIHGHAGLKPTRRSLTAAFMLMGVATAVQAGEILYVSNQGAQRGTGTIDKYNGENGEFIANLVSGLHSSGSLAINPEGNVWLARKPDPATASLYDASTGERLLDVSGLPAVQIGSGAMATHPDSGNLYIEGMRIVDRVNQLVVIDGRSGTYLETFTQGDLKGTASCSLAFNADGSRLYVSDADVVKCYDVPAKKMLGSIAPAQRNPSRFSPVSVAVGPDGGIFVGDKHNRKIWRFDPDGLPRGDVAAGVNPDAMQFGPNGHLFVADSVSSQVMEYDVATGEKVSDFARGGHLKLPDGLVFKSAVTV